MKRFICGICFLSMLLFAGVATAAGGDDCYNVSCGASQQDFRSTPIPPGFFGSGSDPFDGVIRLKGGDPVGPDTSVRRLGDFSFPGVPSTDTVPIEIVSLNLVSCQPIVITGGENAGLWDVNVSLPQLPQQPGHMTATKTHANGGTFEAQFYVQARFTFTKVNPPIVVRNQDLLLDLCTDAPYHWQDTSLKPNPPCNGNGFYVCSSICGVNFVPGGTGGSVDVVTIRRHYPRTGAAMSTDKSVHCDRHELAVERGVNIGEGGGDE